ncbi:ANKZ1-like protein [Mya arenaria]|uniref:ANKZ1-like protein n=1 Tax=Mya arenaria TaxID=6604 RepID=A0ABY7DDD5_MYAAR|nr:ANKZ1-like protein [Mya arenaria]
MATNSPKRVQRVKPKKYTTCQLYNTKEAQCKLVGLTLASCNSASRGKSVIQEEADVPQETLVPDPSQLVVSEVMACNYCDTSFSHRVEQKRHYRSDWHRYNLKLRLKGKNSVPEEVFEDMCDGDTDIDNQPRTGPNKLLPGTQRRLVREGGNTSSTDSESESGNQEIQELIASWRPHLEKCDLIFLRAPSFNRKIFYSGKVPAFKKDDLRIRLIPFQTRRPTNNEVRRVFNPETGNLEPRDENQLSPRKRKLLNKKIGASPLVNETNDNKASGDLENAEPNKEETVSSKPFLPDHIKEETMSSGTSTASDTELIETMATIHFSDLKDEELYHLRNSLYTACKTGDKESLESLLAVIFSPPAAVDNNSEAKHDNAEDIESQKKVDEFDKATIPTAVDNSELNDHIVKAEMNSDKSLLVDTNWKACDTHTDINTTDLDETKEKVTVNISSHQVEHPTAIPDTPSILKPQTIPILSPRTKPTVSTGNKDPLTPVFVSPDIVSEPIGDNNTTLLHVAAKEGHARIVALLLEAGASPVLKDRNGHSPYMASKDKATRNEFRRFRGKWPDRYDYKVAQIPEPLSEEAEAERKRKEQERKKAQKKAKQEQQKAKKEEEEKQKAEDREKQRYLNMSDREKRALAAERRLLNQCSTQGGDKPVLIRCFQCGADMTGKVPFEYCDNKFCTSKCLQQHRKTQTAKK